MVSSGGIGGALFGFISYFFCCLNDNEDSDDYRDFFENQRIIDDSYSIQSSPLLQAHIIEINDEQFTSNNNSNVALTIA